MVKTEKKPLYGILAMPAFPVVLVTVKRNIMTAAAFSFYSFKPPCVMVGVMPTNLTYELISKEREFGINIPTKEQLDVVRTCGSVSGRDEDKFEKAGLTPQKSKVITSYLIAECPVSLECRVVHQIDYPGTHRWFVGQIEAVSAKDDYRRDQALMYWPKEYRRVGDVLLGTARAVPRKVNWRSKT
jgi:flavin reductase (DIM6/NTAB) family NADH-FMN oxidoreductase RutF